MDDEPRREKADIPSIGGEGNGLSKDTELIDDGDGDRAAEAGAGGSRYPSADRIGKWNVSGLGEYGDPGTGDGCSGYDIVGEEIVEIGDKSI